MRPFCAMTTSWDDGDPRDNRVAELLTNYGMPGTFYVPRKAPNTVMSDAQVRALAQGFEIGAHTLTHPRLTELAEERAREEIAGSRQWIQNVTGRGCEMFCPPEGKFIAAHHRMAQEAGFSGLRTVELLSTDAPRQEGSLRVMPTSVQAHPHPRKAYVRNALKRRSITNLTSFARAGCAADWTVLARRLLERVQTQGGVFHLWGHSWEIDDHGQWAPLEDVLRMMASFAETVTPLTNAQIVRDSNTAMH